MGRYFGLDYDGAPFVLFDRAHLLALLLIGLVALSFLALRRAGDGRVRRLVRLGLALWLALWEISAHVWFAGNGLWSIRTMLPLHMCAISAWLCVFTLLTGNYHAYEFAFFLGLGGAAQGLITPEVGCYGFPHYRAWQSFAVHGGIVLSALYMTVVEGYRPTARSFRRVVSWTSLYVAVIFLLNLALGSNYLYLAHKPEFPTLIDQMAPWPWYVPQLLAAAFAVACALYAPFLAGDLRSRVTPPEGRAPSREERL